MYIWVGVDVDSQLGEIKQAAKQAERALGFAHSNFTLPLHVSLKMSFPMADGSAEQAIEDLAAFFSTLKSFDVRVKGIEKWDTILWIRMMPDERLNAIHDRLNGFLADRYGVGLHPYDQDYQFHTTLFMDTDQEKISAAYEQVRSVPVPSVLQLRRFVIGTSPGGALGTYRVVRAIER